MSHIKKDFSYL